MREYGIVSSRFWNRGSGKALRGKPQAQVLALYLMTCGDSSMIGIYPIGLPTIAHETGIAMSELEKLLALLANMDIAHYDHEEELMYLPSLAQHQLGKTLAANDKKIYSVVSQIKSFDGHRFADAFIRRYYEAYHLDRMGPKPEPGCPSKGGYSDAESPSQGGGEVEPKNKKRIQVGTEEDQDPDPQSPPRTHAHVRTHEASPDLDRPEVGGSTSPAREELPPVAPASAQQSRDLRAPTQVQAVLAKAYGDGVRKAAPDVPFPDPSEPKDLRELETMAIAKWKSARIVEAQMWVEKSAYAYRIAMADRAQYESGFAPTSWAKWVKGGGLTQTGAPNAPPQSGQGRFQPVDQSLSPHHPSRRPYKPIVVENDDPTVPIPFPGLTPRPTAVKPKAPAS